MRSHTLLRGGIVFDGVAPERARNDVRIVDGRVAEVGPALALDGAATIDVDGLWIMPGFVDAHSHADAAVLLGNGMEVRALAGVTTEIVGQDGLGLSFAAGAARAPITETLAPIAGELPDEHYDDVAAYLFAADRGAFARVATLVPHGTLRAAAVGTEPRPATADERLEMTRQAEKGIRQGAVGVSTGLSYAPASASDTAELIEMMSALPARTPYVTHLRDYGSGFDSALDEAIEICRRSDTSLHLSHLHVSGPDREGRAVEVIERVEAEPGATWDSYPYRSGCTFIRAVLPASTQGWSLPVLLSELQHPAVCRDVVALMDADGPGQSVAGGWETIRLAGLTGALADWDGRSVSELAVERAATPGAIVARAVIESAGSACVIVTQGHAENIRVIAEAGGHMVGSDGIMGSGIPHPRAAHSFWRFLHWAVSGTIDSPVERMVARMTSVPARRFSLPVGRIVAGAVADLLVVDPRELESGPDAGTTRPRALVHSFIGGEPAVGDGAWAGERLAGMALRGSRCPS